MARRAAYVDSLRREGAALLLLDAGNFFSTDDRTTDIKSVVSWKEMERLRYDAVVLGRRELDNWRLVRQLLRESSLPLVTTNLEAQRGGQWQTVGASHIIVARAGLRIGILGLLPPAEIPEWMIRSARDSLRLLPMAPAARRAREEMGSEVDLVVALVADSPGYAISPTPEIPEADILIHGRSCCTIAGVNINEASSAGRALGVTCLVISPGDGIVSFEDRSVQLTEAMSEDRIIAEDAQKIHARSQYLRWQERRERERRYGDER